MLSHPSDTLVMDTAKLDVWRQDSNYDYGRELVSDGSDPWKWLEMQITRIMNTLFGSEFYQQNQKVIWVVIALVVLLALVIFVLYKNPHIFERSSNINTGIDYQVSEDTIYGIDFDMEIEKAMGRKDFREALRLTYLQTLKHLHNNHLIDWQPFKTPSQYTGEYPYSDFRKMTRMFVRVRYGNFEATMEMMEEMRICQQHIGENLQTDTAKGGGR